MSKNYDVTIKWHTPEDATVRETVVKTWASSPKLADKIGLRGARLDRTIPENAIVDSPAIEALRVVEPSPSAPVGAVINIRSDKPIPALDEMAKRDTPAAMQIKTLDDLKRALATPGIVISVVNHWQPEFVGTTLPKMKGGIPSYAAALRFNEDGTVTFYPKGRKSWTLAFSADAEAA
jgi:hypothetical protein